MIEAALGAVAVLLALAPAAIALSLNARGSVIVYGASLAVSTVLCAIALVHLLDPAQSVAAVVLPIGLPWLGAHFRLDALAAFFLLVVNLLGCAAAVYGIGYGTHEREPWRVLPFFPVFLAGMNLVPLADDAFSFLVAWEFMSLSSWLLVLS